MLLVVVLIGSYKRQTAAYIEEINRQKKNLEESEKRLYKMAYYDSLTGLHNREWFVEYLNKSIHSAQRRICLIGVIFIDLDSFKSINDTMGHSFGDYALKLLAKRLSSRIREEDAIARFSGDEFLIMVSDIKKLEDLRKIADRIMKVFQTLTNQLYRALDNKELILYYQPQVTADTQKIIGFEALLRWNNKKYGFITPDVFIPMAEQTGLIKTIGLWVFKTACEDLKAFQSRFNENFSMSINFSLEQLRDDDIADKINRIINETGTNPANIQVEITESTAFNEDAVILRRLEELKALGLSIAVDDFGTGFSSFTRLKTFPIDLLKIDMCFVHGLSSGSQKDRSIIKSIIQLAKNLGIETLAEGVETKDQFLHLKENGCNFIQGHYFYKPMPVNEIESLLQGKSDKIP